VQKVALVGSGWQLFFEALCLPFRPRLLRGSSSRIALDRCESEVNLIVHRERPRQTAAWKKKPGRSLMVWGGFPNPPGCVKEGTSGLGNPLHGFLLSATAD
jgi:hypothetical protein